LIAVPAIYDACSEARKHARLAKLLRLADAAQRNVLGAAGDIVRKRDAFLGGALHMLIASMKPTNIALTRMLCGAPSIERSFVSAMRLHAIWWSARCRRAALGADVEHIDDAAPTPLLHLRPDQAREPDRGEQLLVQVLAPDLVGDRLEAPLREVPALLTTMSILPKARMPSSKIPLTSSGLPTSPCAPTTRPFAPALIDLTAASSASRPRDAISTSAPEAAKRLAMAKPSPLLPR